MATTRLQSSSIKRFIHTLRYTLLSEAMTIPEKMEKIKELTIANENIMKKEIFHSFRVHLYMISYYQDTFSDVIISKHFNSLENKMKVF